MLAANFTVADQALNVEQADHLSRDLVEFWRARRRPGAPPTRRDIDPCDLGRWIGRLHLWQTTEDGDFLCRIWGTAITPCIGGKRDGMRLSEGRPRAYFEAGARHFRAVLERGEPTIHRIRLSYNGHSCDYERTALPLAAGAGTPAMVLNLSLWDPKLMRAFFREVEKSDPLIAVASPAERQSHS